MSIENRLVWTSKRQLRAARRRARRVLEAIAASPREGDVEVVDRLWWAWPSLPEGGDVTRFRAAAAAAAREADGL